MNGYVFPGKISAGPLGTVDMSDGSEAPNVRIIPPLVYLAGIVIGFLTTIWMPTKVVPNSVAWTVGGIIILCGAVLTGSAVLTFKNVGTAVRPDRAANTLVIAGPYKITRNPMYLALALVYLGALEDATGKDANLTPPIRNVGSVVHQPADFGKVMHRICRGDLDLALCGHNPPLRLEDRRHR